MKNNLYYLIILFFLFNCSSKKDELLIDIKAFKNQGTEIFLENNKENLAEEVKKIKKISNYQSFNLNNWFHPNFQNSNFIPHSQYSGSLNIKKKTKHFSSVKSNIYDKNILSFDNKLFYIDDLGSIYSLDLNLRILKKFSLYKKKDFQDYLLKFSLSSDGEYLYISDNLGNIHSYDPKLNKIKWSTKLGVPFVSNLVLYKNNLYVLNDNGKIYSFDSKTGSQNWSYESATNILKNYSAFQVVADLDKLIFSNDLGDIYCIDLVQKNLAWSLNVEVNTNLAISNNLLQLSKIIIKDNDVFISTNKNKIINVNLNTGQINWSQDLPYSSTVTSLVVPNNIINFTNNGYVSIFDKANGSILYKKNILINFENLIKKSGKDFLFKYAFISSNYLYIVSQNGIFFKIDTSDFNNISYKKIAKHLSSNPVIILNNIYILDGNGAIYQIN
jgi:outer membrane protein assembly factor BamB